MPRILLPEMAKNKGEEESNIMWNRSDQTGQQVAQDREPWENENKLFAPGCKARNGNLNTFQWSFELRWNS